MSDEIRQIQMLASTAQWTAAVRAKESVRRDRLFHDPWAAVLAGPTGMAWIERRSSDSVIPIVLRTRFFDDFLQRIVTDNAIHQVVLMAAGLDTRAFRLNWPAQTRLFELDQPALLEYKERIVSSVAAKPTCERCAVAVDLTSSWEASLQAAGFDPQKPSAWLLEGFLFYLSTGDLTHLLDRVSNLAAPGSFIGFDAINSITLTSELTKSWVEMQAGAGAPWIGTMDDPQGFLAARNWQASLTLLGDPEASYGRWPFPVIPSTVPGMPRLWFVVAEKEHPIKP